MVNSFDWGFTGIDVSGVLMYGNPSPNLIFRLSAHYQLERNGAKWSKMCVCVCVCVGGGGGGFSFGFNYRTNCIAYNLSQILK